MLTNIFDQKPLRSASQAFYFQLVPRQLSKISPLQKAQEEDYQYRLKIIKGMQICDQMKKQLKIKLSKGNGSFQNINLSFTLPNYNPNRNIEFTLILLRSQNEKEEEEIGRYTILSSNFVVEYKDSNTKFYQETATFNQDFSIKFDLYMDNSRFSLEKLIKEMEENKKIERVSTSNSKNVNQYKPKFNQTRSQILSNSQNGGHTNQSQGQFMSPTRKIVRKQSDSSRKLLRKMDSPTRSQDETSPRRLLKVLSRNSQKEELIAAEKFSNLTEQQAWKLSQRIRQEEQKREKARIQQLKQIEAERVKKQIQKQKQDDLAKKRMEEQRIEALLKAEQQRLEYRRRQERRAEEKKQADRKNEQIRKQRQLKRVQAMKKKEEQEIKKKQMEDMEKNKQQEKAKIVNQKTKPQTTNKLQKNKGKQVPTVHQNDKKINAVSEKVKKPITVRVTTQNQVPVVNVVYDAKTPSSKESTPWKNKIEFKQTGSQIFDKNGNLVKGSKQNLDGDGNNGMKKKLGIGLIIILLFFGLAYFMNPSAALKKKKKKK